MLKLAGDTNIHTHINIIYIVCLNMLISKLIDVVICYIATLIQCLPIQQMSE